MSVYIRGMEMPKSCFECPWRCKVDPENLLCRISGEYFEETFSGTIQNRHKSCPLVPVPPHGRLGDLDEIVRYKERLVVDADKINPAIRYVVDTKYIEGTPTIIPAEEARHET